MSKKPPLWRFIVTCKISRKADVITSSADYTGYGVASGLFESWVAGTVLHCMIFIGQHKSRKWSQYLSPPKGPAADIFSNSAGKTKNNRRACINNGSIQFLRWKERGVVRTPLIPSKSSSVTSEAWICLFPSENVSWNLKFCACAPSTFFATFFFFYTTMHGSRV